MFGIKGLILQVVLLVVLFSNYLKAEKLTIITYSEVPFASQNEDKKQGLVIELIEALFNQAGMEYEVLFYPLKRGMAMAASDKNTCVLPIERNQQRETHFSWIGPVMLSRYGLFSRKPLLDPLITLSDAKSSSIGSFLGSGIGEYLINSGYEVELTNNDRLNIKKLERGRINFWAADIVSAKALMKNEGLAFIEPELIFYTSIRAMACHYDLLESTQKLLNDALLFLYRSGYMAQLNRKYGLEL
ncbi:substrate-binding periplasmic protein [Shewanella sp. HL-SH8]|uniref:substrate-binding periplasmic protein n=1 Tax=Shewanella sp. HL-SH8 TaxID=3436242 RepID=UPI003EBA950F